MKIYLTIIIIFLSNMSFAQNAKVEKFDFCAIITEMFESDQKYRSMNKIKTFEKQKSTKVYDSLMKLQTVIDNMNTEKLLKLVKEKGWPDQRKLNCEREIFPMIIFRHSQRQYFDEIANILEEELKENRISDWEYKMINNHLNGRPKKIN
ncbi:hypothetical protein JM83_1541 [Gillisia sp. Hel_I_86]|uniref:hypothetical protein n=1 Tax=Gillisia sp. Hel_I_86 TaxID=1249981 RepID=UPI00119B2509|nr:hypothetical protein [Gillisia sp. Hel_I_86]TVZ26549.1 hypothetical protein JM83_1522 [Gillisia sp. Hel_I_86]TVZ26567.1 hypothetical protein JM83_1541 [Gillisia sp. Hel_I_86]